MLDNDTLEYLLNAIGSIVDMVNAHHIRIDNYDQPSGCELFLFCRLFVLDAILAQALLLIHCCVLTEQTNPFVSLSR